VLGVAAAAVAIAAGGAAAVALLAEGETTGETGANSDANSANTRASSDASSAAASGPTTVVSAVGSTAAVGWDGPCPERMTLIPGGTFTMGSDQHVLPLSKPAHTVTLDSFCLGDNEVTVADYKRCVEDGGCTPADTRPRFDPLGGSSPDEHDELLDAFAELCNWEAEGRARHPVNCLDWYRADSYCRRYGFRLPTEAEWELAARGGDQRKHPWGDDHGDATFLNAAGTEWRDWLVAHDLPPPQSLMYEASDRYAGTAPVGTFGKGRGKHGQLDMLGNVWEWTADWYAVYGDDPEVNPKGPAGGDRKAIRGGGFNGEVAMWLSPAARYHQKADASVHAIGFRCAADVRPQK
jgi:formylglycine-generating enzyme required for sulfatase activity